MSFTETTTRAAGSRILSRGTMRITPLTPSSILRLQTTPLSYRTRKGAFPQHSVQRTSYLLTGYLHLVSSSTIVGSMLCVWGFVVSVRWRLTISPGQKQITPRFEFGFGLSYTTFEYSSLRIEKLKYSEQFPEEAVWESGKTPSTNATGASRAIWLHRPAYCITFDVQNSGAVAGTEVG